MASLITSPFLKEVSTAQDGAAGTGMRRGLGLLIEDPVHWRLVESAALQLDLKVYDLNRSTLDKEELLDLEMVIVDPKMADHVRAMLDGREGQDESMGPAVISVQVGDDTAPAMSTGRPNDGVLALPQSLSQLAAQLSVILYSHRAFARQYQDALEELHLNRRIFRSVTSGISVANALVPDLPLTYVNPAFEVMTGYSLEEVVGRNCRFLQGDQRNQPATETLREAIAAQREVTVVLRNFRKDGTPFWNELSLSPIRNREDQVTHFVGIQTDVTARVEFEAALRESEKLAAVGRLASTIAHEVNNPLESVMNLVYLAQHAGDPEETRKYLATADAELQRVKLITTQSLRFFKQSTRAQEVQCGDLLASVLDLYQSRLQNAGVTVERRMRPAPSLLCMESEIRQVLNNLVSNAIDAMQRTGGRLLVRTRVGSEPRSGEPGVFITIADNGTGIDPEVMKDIYKAFYTTKGMSGTGLGLWISSGIVERHSGRLMVRSSRGAQLHGTAFELFLPLRASNAIMANR